MSRPLRLELLEHRITPTYGLDPTFGFGGQAITAPDSGLSDKVVVQANGKILVLGDASHWLEIRRLSSDGTPDNTFGVGGLVVFGHGRSQLFPSNSGLALDSNGRIYSAVSLGSVESADAVVYRFNSDGTADAGFGTGGVSSFDFPGATASTVTGLAVMPDGRAVVLGDADRPTTAGFSVARLTATGTLDRTFDGDGFSRYEFGSEFAGGSSWANDVVVEIGRASCRERVCT